ncbi:MAG: transposase [Planctomycetota bacterium]
MARQRHKHLSRLARVWVKDPVFYITTCTRDRAAILVANDVVEILRGNWKRCSPLYAWAVGPYVVMPDHVHFFCWSARDAATLSEFVGKWKEWTSKRIARLPGITGPVWQQEFFDHVLRSSESYRAKWQYMRENPVRAGLVSHAEEWPYSGQICDG